MAINDEFKDGAILLVEDNPDDVELAIRAFKKHNLNNEIKVARDGVEALDYLFGRGAYADRDISKEPILILLDLKMPKMDGLEVLMHIKADLRTKMIPVVILTTSNEEQDMVDGYKIGVNSYIRKPVDFEQFVGAVEQIGLYWTILNKTPGQILSE